MITVQENLVENLSANAEMEPVMCPKCGYKRLFYTPAGARVRRSRRGNTPQSEPVCMLKCKKCRQTVSISVE